MVLFCSLKVQKLVQRSPTSAEQGLSQQLLECLNFVPRIELGLQILHYWSVKSISKVEGFNATASE